MDSVTRTLDRLKGTFSELTPQYEVDFERGGSEVSQGDWLSARRNLSRARDAYNAGEVITQLDAESQEVREDLIITEDEFNHKMHKVGRALHNFKSRDRIVDELKIVNEDARDDLENVIDAAYYFSREADPNEIIEAAVDYQKHALIGNFETMGGEHLAEINYFDREYIEQDEPTLDIIY